MKASLAFLFVACTCLVGGIALAERSAPPQHTPPSTTVVTPAELELDAQPMGTCKSSKRKCRPSVHKGTGCDTGGCDCKKGEVCEPNPKATPGSPFTGQCLCR